MDLDTFRTQLDAWLDAHANELRPAPEANTLDDHLAHVAKVKRLTFDDGWMRWGWPERVGGLGGSTILRAQCEIEEPAPTVLRDIVYHMGPAMVPLHLHVQLMLDDEFLGSGWMRHDVAAKTVECESWAPSTGRRSECRAVGDFDGFGTHPVVADAYATRLMAGAPEGSRRQLRVPCDASSTMQHPRTLPQQSALRGSPRRLR